jgi:hypothetical protein
MFYAYQLNTRRLGNPALFPTNFIDQFSLTNLGQDGVFPVLKLKLVGELFNLLIFSLLADGILL